MCKMHTNVSKINHYPEKKLKLYILLSEINFEELQSYIDVCEYNTAQTNLYTLPYTIAIQSQCINCSECCTYHRGLR